MGITDNGGWWIPYNLEWQIMGNEYNWDHLSIYLDFVSLDGESIQFLWDQAHFKLSVIKVFKSHHK